MRLSVPAVLVIDSLSVPRCSSSRATGSPDVLFFMQTHHCFVCCYVVRAPSPEPLYDSNGKLLNSRENRIRKSALEAREKLLDYMIMSYPDIVRLANMCVSCWQYCRL